MDRLMMSTHSLAVRINCSVLKLAKLYIREIVRLHSKQLQESLGTRLNFNTTLHPHSDGQSE
ncbi:Gag protease polyprotein [Gossypium australe]|uniref:Gag protease polyprotein n=1 Tax=Gossypium australe TaxID=47621 RepID=A0A5B6WR94_9ROSI|nr:Gag protease polyprotein [Gossypium australe]